VTDGNFIGNSTHPHISNQAMDSVGLLRRCLLQLDLVLASAQISGLAGGEKPSKYWV